jgi:hypothetical protein
MRLFLLVLFGFISGHAWALGCTDPLLQGTGKARCAQQCLSLGTACTSAHPKAASAVPATTTPPLGQRFARVTQQAAAPLPPPPHMLEHEDLNPVTGVLTPWQANVPVPVVVTPEPEPEPPPAPKPVPAAMPTAPPFVSAAAPPTPQPMVQPVFIFLAPKPFPPPRYAQATQLAPQPPALPAISSTEAISTTTLAVAALQPATS